MASLTFTWALDFIAKHGHFYTGIRSLDESRRLDQSETVKVARAVKQKYYKCLGSAPNAPEILVTLCLISSKINLKTDDPPPNTLNFFICSFYHIWRAL